MHKFGTTVSSLLVALACPAIAQVDAYRPVDDAMLLNPDPADWLMLNRTYDEQRFSPLAQLNRDNVDGLQLAWARGLPLGSQETVPIVHDGVLYVVQPGASIIAVDATTGDEIWTYYRNIPAEVTGVIGRPELSRTKSIGIYADLILYPAPDGFLVALDARTGALRWETKIHEPADQTEHTGGVLVAEGKVITNRTCETRAGCFIAAHDARTGEELWKFYNTAAPGTSDGETWGDVPLEARAASSWGLPGSYDPERRITYWGIANPKPYTRLSRHGSADAISNTAPADLYSNSTVALDVDTGELVWYYQHSPGDDWDLDHLHERTLLSTRLEPDPAAVKWINPSLARGTERDVVVAVGEGGGIWTLDRATGEFLWATPFPYDIPEFHISNINV
ncbi:MAG TPA: PQQ-binding-like beta-propeller repeat protein, partial [Gammaproteobacteria bacterium]|nr:PQQ-binding-like beta-propeller repeat protein [Gammaproteobacteria bacterium]